MARSAGIQVNNNLVGGLVTETTGLNFPENAASDILNCVLDKTGKASRRLGILYESSNQFKTINKSGCAINSFHWKNAGNDGNRTFYVLQIGMTIYFYEVFGGEYPLSAGAESFSINLNSYFVGGSNPEQVDCSFSYGLGYMFITHPNIDPLYVTFDNDASTFSVNRLTLEIRDFEGVDDGLDWDERPDDLSDLHKYNLFNQGWYQRVLNAAGLGADVLNAWRNDGRTFRGDYPSNADVWWYFKGPFPFNTEDVIGSNSEYFRNILVSTVSIGNSPAPKGHYLLNLHYQDRTAVSEVPGIPVQASSSRVSCNAFYAGRVFYSGLSGEGFVGKVYFTQIVEREEQLGACYQQMDPTAESNSDLLPSDGGVISISDCGTVLRLQPVGNSLIVWASNGIWAITGSEGISFRANDYAVTKISSVPILSAGNFVDVEDTPIWWNQNGIYTLSVLDQIGNVQVRSLSDEKVKTFIDNIPVDCKLYVRGYYNSFSKTIQWLYRSTSPTTVDERYTYDSVLVYDTMLNCFYPWSLPDTSITFHGIVVVDGKNYTLSNETVTTGTGDVTDLSLEDVTVNISLSSPNVGTFKYLVFVGDQATFAEARNIHHVDWEGNGDISFDSYMDLGYKVHGDGMRKFQPTYVTLFSDNTSPTTYDFFVKWNWANTGTTGKWSSVQRVMSLPSNYDVSFTRRKVRGHGIALQFRIQSVDAEGFSLIGYSIYETGNQTP